MVDDDEVYGGIYTSGMFVLCFATLERVEAGCEGYGNRVELSVRDGSVGEDPWFSFAIC